ncbi:MAG: hypothetical protein GX977_03420 [Firmicutes bacterium]|nr:hypothetical protein [Bacillota bacterium]
MLKRVAMVTLLLVLVGLLSVNKVQAQSIHLWAIEATANSEYSNSRWSAAQMVGAPDTYPRYGDIDTAWTTAYMNTTDNVWADLQYAEAIIVEKIEIYETYNPGAITKVELIDEAGSSYEVWRGDAWIAPKQSRILRISNTRVETPIKRVRLYLDCSKIPGYNEIDAVGITGRRPTQITYTAPTSSSYDNPLTELDALLTRLEGAIKLATENKSANPAFLRDLESILWKLQSISNELYEELGTPISEWGEY